MSAQLPMIVADSTETAIARNARWESHFGAIATRPIATIEDSPIEGEYIILSIDLRGCPLSLRIVREDCKAAARRVAEVWRQYVSILRAFVRV